MWPLKQLFHFTLQTEVVINAPLKTVWEVLTDFEHYREWNPHFYLLQRIDLASGLPKELLIHLHWPGLSPSEYRLQVTEFEPFKQVSGLGLYKVPRLMDGHSHYSLQEIHSNQTRLIHQEDFRGLLVPLFLPWLKTSIHQGFLNMDHAFKGRCLRFRLHQAVEAEH